MHVYRYCTNAPIRLDVCCKQHEIIHLLSDNNEFIRLLHRSCSLSFTTTYYYNRGGVSTEKKRNATLYCQSRYQDEHTNVSQTTRAVSKTLLQ